MVTEAGKELLRNSIHTAKFHNRILEENEMWKQWELERGLTMMVSDDIIKQKTKHHQCSKHKKQDKVKIPANSDKSKDKEFLIDRPSSSKKVTDRWDHSGFEELYPNGIKSEKDTKSSRSTSRRWSHGGFEELHPSDMKSDKGVASSASSSSSSKKWDHSGFEKIYPNDTRSQKSIASSPSSSSSLRKMKKRKKKRHKKKTSSYSNSSDNEIWEEFKSFKRKKKSDEHTVASPRDLKEPCNNIKDSHIKLWKKHRSKQ